MYNLIFSILHPSKISEIIYKLQGILWTIIFWQFLKNKMISEIKYSVSTVIYYLYLFYFISACSIPILNSNSYISLRYRGADHPQFLKSKGCINNPHFWKLSPRELFFPDRKKLTKFLELHLNCSWVKAVLGPKSLRSLGCQAFLVESSQLFNGKIASTEYLLLNITYTVYA